MLQIRVVSVAGQSPAVPITAQFGPAGGTIGRNEGNTLVLPDEAKTISRQHAVIQAQGSQYLLTDRGANATLRNGVPVGNGQTVPLMPGDELRIGPYVLVVEAPAPAFDPNSTQVAQPGGFGAFPGAVPGLAPQAPPAMPVPGGPAFGPVPPAAPGFPPPADPLPPPFGAAPAAPGHVPVAAPAFPTPPVTPAPAAFDPFAVPPTPAGAPAAPADPFADLFGPASAPAAPMPPAAPAAPAGGIPDDFDPFASLIKEAPKAEPEPFNPFATGARKPAPIPFEPAAPHEDLLGSAGEKPASIDELFGLGGSSANPLDVLQAGSAAPAPAATPVDDPLALFGGPANPAGVGAAVPDQTPLVDQPFVPPRPVNPPPAPATPPTPVSAQAIDDLLAAVPVAPSHASTGQFKVATPANVDTPQPLAQPAAAPTPAAAAPSGQPGLDVLMGAFCEGLGSPLNLPDGVTEEFMFRIGGLVREAVFGTVDLLNARAVTKREVKASATVIMERNNNPLKFSPDAQTALLYLVSGRLNPAFMPPITAMRDAFDDLRSHQFGFMAGTKAALEGVLERFEPQQLENRLASKGLIDSLIPAARKARLWDLFNELYKEIAREAEDDFHALFGQAFLKAYEEHVEALRRERPEPR